MFWCLGCELVLCRFWCLTWVDFGLVWVVFRIGFGLICLGWI